MDKITHDVRLAQWTEVIKQCQTRPEGISVKTWCRQNGVNEKVYFYVSVKPDAYVIMLSIYY